MSGKRESCAEHGFTLVELLVALTLFALLMMLLFGGVHFATRAVAHGTRLLDRTADLSLATTFLHDELADAQPIPGPGAGDAALRFDGEPAGLAFLAPVAAHLGDGGLRAFRVGFIRQGSRRQLLVDSGLDGGAATADTRSILLTDIAGVRFAYFGSIEAAAKPDWQAQWTGMDHLPLLVRMSIVFADGSRAPDLVVALRAAAPLEDLPP